MRYEYTIWESLLYTDFDNFYLKLKLYDAFMCTEQINKNKEVL